ncbi:MAG: hypothetical protein ACLS5Z_10345 [Clostridium fessum]
MVGVGNVVQNDGNIFEILGIVVRGGIISTLGCIGCLGVVGSLAGSSGRCAGAASQRASGEAGSGKQCSNRFLFHHKSS